MTELIKPRPLRRGGVIGIAAPAGPVDAATLQAGEVMLRDAGFEVRRRDDLLAKTGYLAGSDARRAEELSSWIADPEIDCVICARGGYGCARIFDSLDANAFRSARKPLVGFSDITALLLWQQRCAGLVGFHGPMLDRGEDFDPAALDHLFGQLCADGDAAPILRGMGSAGGRATGRLVGGSLTLVAASLGTPWEIDTQGAIVMFEDVGEKPYRVDRMLDQLRSAGKLETALAFGVGSFSGCDDPNLLQPGVESVLEDALCGLGVPVVTGLPFGHVAANYAWPVGGRATIDGGTGELSLLEWGVEDS